FSKSTSVTQNNVANDFSKLVTAQNLPANKKSILKNTNGLTPGMYKIHTDHTQTRTSKLPPDSRKTNKRVTFSIGVIPSTSVSRPQLKSNPMEDRVLRNNSHGKKQELIEIVLFIVDFGCSKHMTGNLKLLINFVEKFLGTVNFGNDQIAPILGYGDLTLHAYFAAEGIQHQTSVARTPEQNCVVERRNLIPRHEKTPYHIINDRKPSVKFFHIFGSVCYIVRDEENLNKMKEKGDECIFVGYSTQSRAYRVFNKRTRVIMESIHVNFDELPQMASDQLSSDPAPECQTMALDHDSLSLVIQRQVNVTQADRTVTTSNELDFLYSLMFDELLNGSSKVVSKSSAVSAADAPDQHQNHTTPLNNHTTPAPSCQIPTLEPTFISSENINQAETYAENDQVADDEFINIFSTPVHDQEETLSQQVIGNPSQSVRTRRQLKSNAEMCMFALSVSRTEPKNIKESMADFAWIESMQEELHQFDRLDVWELIDRPLCTNVLNLKWL
nr:hypothetical protein [Tanacetum cinerariifolium]